MWLNRPDAGCNETGCRGTVIQSREAAGLIQENPYQKSPQYEKPTGDLVGAISRRIDIQHLLIYQVLGKVRVVKVICMPPYSGAKYLVLSRKRPPIFELFNETLGY